MRVLNPSILDLVDVGEATIERIAAREEVELKRRAAEYRGDRREAEVAGRTVILVDDGPAQVVVAVPVAAKETCDQFAGEVDEIICLLTPEPFHAVGIWYEDFDQTTDEEVRALLAEAWSSGPGRPPESHAASGGAR